MSVLARLTHRVQLGLVLGLAFVVRVIAHCIHPDTYPDAYFQYVEPAWWTVRGYGYPTWEWAVGFRSWIPAAYYGIWLELLGWVGIRDAGHLALFFGLQGCALGVLLVWAVYRIAHGLLDARAGVLAALFAACSPVLAYYSPQTIIEPPSMVPALWGLAFVYGKNARGEERHSPLLAGFLLGLAGMLRLPIAVVGAFVAFEYAFRAIARKGTLRARTTPLVLLVAAALVPIAVFGLVDWATWGKPFHSTVQFVEYHLKGRGREHGAVELFDFYPKLFWDRAWSLVVLVLVAFLLSVKRSWPTALRIAILVVLAVYPQMIQPQKLERFVLLFWPLFYVLLGVVLSAAVERLRAWSPRLALGFATIVVLALGFSTRQAVASLKVGPKYDYAELWGLFDGQTDVGRRADATGLLFESRPHLTGGWYRLGVNLPFAPFTPQLLKNPVFNYVILRKDSRSARTLEQSQFSPVADHGDFRVWHRVATAPTR